jgi:hypothetical protein
MVAFIGTGAAATGNNTSLNPALPAGVQAGDVLLLLASIRNSGTGVPAVPAGWTALVLAGNVRLMGKLATSSESAPTVAFANGVAGADTLAQIAAFRSVSLNALQADAQLNGPAQDIAYPAWGVGSAGRLVVWFGWKQDDWASITGPGVAIGTAVSTAGDDAAQGWRCSIASAAASGAAGSLTVTGGAGAISRGGVLILGAALSAVEQDTWPPRMLVSATGIGIGDTVTIARVVGSTRTPVRGADAVTAVDPSLVVTDAELPFGVPVSYVLQLDGVDVATTTPATHTLPGGKVAVTDAIEGSAAEVVILARPERTRTRVASSYVVGGRTVMVSGPMGDPTGQIELHTDTTAGADNLVGVLDGATGGIVQIRQPGGYAGIDAHLAVAGYREVRASQDGTDPRRRWVLDTAEIEPWPTSSVARGYTLQDIADAYAGLTLADLAGDYSTLLAVAQHDWAL